MPLTEEQIVRFSRQILLQQVGGVGQARLLASTLHVRSDGPAERTCAAYVAAGGGGVKAPPCTEGATVPGFLEDWALLTTQPSGGEGAVTVLTSAPSVEGVPAATHTIVLGAQGGEAVIVFAARDGCPACVAEATGRLEAPPAWAGELQGALAALVHQRFALGLEAGAGVLRMRADGSIRREALRACGACRS